jgi:hypothetical protein
MSVIVNHEPFDTDALGLATLGDVIGHFQASNTFITQILVDGQQPNMDDFDSTAASPVDMHTIFITTGDPRQLARETLDDVHALLGNADEQRRQTADLLGAGDQQNAMRYLGDCFSAWHVAHESVIKTVQLLQLDLEQIQVGDRRLLDVLSEFSTHLRQVKDALQQHDYVTLNDILTYEMTDTTPTWTATIDAVRRAAA